MTTLSLKALKALYKKAPKHQSLAEINQMLFLIRAKGKIVKACKNIELLHGVPVDMPDEVIEKIWLEVESIIGVLRTQILSDLLKINKRR